MVFLAEFPDFCCIQLNVRQTEAADTLAWHIPIPGFVSTIFQGADAVGSLFPMGFLFLPMNISSLCPWLVSLDGK